MKEVVFNDKAVEFFKGEQKKALNDIAVTVVHKDTLKNKDKVINDLLKRISDLEFEVERLEKRVEQEKRIVDIKDKDIVRLYERIDKAIKYIEKTYLIDYEYEKRYKLKDQWYAIELLKILKGVDKE